MLLLFIQSMIFAMEDIIICLLDKTAWSMEAPQLFGSFHIISALLAAASAAAAAVCFARRDAGKKDITTVLFLTGCVLVLLEAYKQLFLYYIVNDGAFDLWFFPFQLCSVPMYLCVLLPLMKDGLRVPAMTFMGGYTFVSASAALIWPEDMLRPYISLTVHGFVWHGLLLFISLLILMTGSADTGPRGRRGAAALYSAMCLAALGINTAAEHIMPAIRAAHPSVAHDWAAMFYLNPYHISPQPVVSTVQHAAGIPAGLILYALTVPAAGILAGYLLSRLFVLDVEPPK